MNVIVTGEDCEARLEYKIEKHCFQVGEAKVESNESND